MGVLKFDGQHLDDVDEIGGGGDAKLGFRLRAAHTKTEDEAESQHGENLSRWLGAGHRKSNSVWSISDIINFQQTSGHGALWFPRRGQDNPVAAGAQVCRGKEMGCGGQ